MVNDDGAGAQALCQAMFAVDDGAHIFVAPHAQQDDLGVPHGFCRCRRASARKLGAPLLGLGRCAVVDPELMPGARQVPGHRVAHHPEADEAYAPRRFNHAG